MDNSVLEVWQSVAGQNDQAYIIPDGCCDLIFKSRPGQEPVWFVSDLAETSQIVSVEKGDHFTGYRLRAGSEVQIDTLVNAVHGRFPDQETLDLINHYTTCDDNIDEALQCLASNVVTVQDAALTLGISARTLQRHIVHKTGKSPVFWHRLARVRKAGRDIQQANSLAEFAFEYGFSDQAHMTREFKQWFSLSPRAFQKISLKEGIFQVGYE
ncbi:AraC family transcriptional regulator [Kiloniella sp. EL199]|uniref:helix-turn-helix domain-containing protein n=1 Tax=Kiloniella sp. EL199 TaxID=2107581 RepID=UPI000EA2E402|nr:helix-turn-helix domain-containing protein [Kiloniella sp. EL199]